MRMNMRQQLPKKVTMVEVMLRDGLQHAIKFVPTETKLWFADQFIRAGYEVIEVTNFSPPKLLPQTKDAEDLLKRLWELKPVKEGKVYLKCYGMNTKAFERAAKITQAGYPPHTVTFTISAEDLHGRRNSGKTREEYFQEIPNLVKIARENGFDMIWLLPVPMAPHALGLYP